MHAAPEADDEAIAKRGPGKWTPKWTGPHQIIDKQQPGANRNVRYTFRHMERGVTITTHANRLCLFRPWSTTVPSTSREIDAARPFAMGSWVRVGSLVVVPLSTPYPFGIGRVTSATPDGNLDIQWLGYSGNNLAPHTNPLFPAWTTPKRLEPYYAASPKSQSHRAYTVADDFPHGHFHQSDVVLHSFELTKGGRIPAPVTRAISNHPDVWWTLDPPPAASGTGADN